MNDSVPLDVVTNHRGYAAQRNIISLPFDNVRIQRRVDPFKVLDHIQYKLFGGSVYLHNLWVDAGQHRLVHLLDGISLGRSPWISSFQDYLPRWGIAGDRGVAAGIRVMAGDRCRMLLAHSEAARNRQLVYTDMKAPAHTARIADKLRVLHPPQAPLVDSRADEQSGPDVTFILVGHAFFLKGGGEVLRTFDRLIGEGAPIRLVIVSKLLHGDFASRTTAADAAAARAIIARHPDRITHHPELPWTDVLDLYRHADIGLLPTWSETYGFSVLEAQAAGCPVITTSINALPEINSGEIGWMIDVPQHEWKVHALAATPEQRAILSRTIEEQLRSIIESIVADRAVIRHRGSLALDRIRREHDPARQAAALERIYREALA